MGIAFVIITCLTWAGHVVAVPGEVNLGKAFLPSGSFTMPSRPSAVDTVASVRAADGDANIEIARAVEHLMKDNDNLKMRIREEKMRIMKLKLRSAQDQHAKTSETGTDSPSQPDMTWGIRFFAIFVAAAVGLSVLKQYYSRGRRVFETMSRTQFAARRMRGGNIGMNAAAPRPVQIIPSVLPADWANMGQCVKDLEEAGADRILFDAMDGNYVPSLTFGPEMIAACRKYCKTPFETYLTVNESTIDNLLDEYTKATLGPNGEPGVVIVHVESCTHLHRTLGKIRDLGGSPAVALNPHTPIAMVKNVLDMVDHVLVMTVNPGFTGQTFIPTMVDKIRDLRAAIVAGGYDVDIEVDGGIKADWTLSQCAAAGANCFIAGSGMFAYPTLKEGCDALRKVAEDARAGSVLEKPA